MCWFFTFKVMECKSTWHSNTLRLRRLYNYIRHRGKRETTQGGAYKYENLIHLIFISNVFQTYFVVL